MKGYEGGKKGGMPKGKMPGKKGGMPMPTNKKNKSGC